MVSIVIPNYNGKDYLEDCIKSIYENCTVPVEIIIIDNASVDDDLCWIKTYYKEVTLKRLKRNYGFSYAVNRGIMLATHPYVLLLNNDTKILEGFVESMLAMIGRDEKIFGVSSQMLRYDDPTVIDDAGDSYTLLGYTKKRGDGQQATEFDTPCEVFSACAGAALYRKSVFDEIGYFDQSFFAYMEDVDISYRARNYGYKNVYCPDAKVLHIGSATSGSRHNAFKVRLAARNNVYVPYKNMPMPQLLLNMPFIVGGVAVKAAYFAKKGYGEEYIGGVKEGVSTLGNVRREKFNPNHVANYLNVQKQLICNTAKIIFRAKD